jgi:hypothetical protein
MPSRPVAETIESLRRTLLRIEHDDAAYPESLEQLKRILLHRIAELELELALQAQLTPLIHGAPTAPAEPVARPCRNVIQITPILE